MKVRKVMKKPAMSFIDAETPSMKVSKVMKTVMKATPATNLGDAGTPSMQVSKVMKTVMKAKRGGR